MSHDSADKLDSRELMEAVERFERELDRAYDLKEHTVTVRFLDGVTVLRALNILIRLNKKENEN